MQTTSFAERRHNAAAAERSNADRRAALACNELLTLTQANVLRLAMDALPEAAAEIAERAFEVYGWPADALETAWLDEAGRITWAVYRAYRGEDQAKIGAVA
jgi:hypothetical protein